MDLVTWRLPASRIKLTLPSGLDVFLAVETRAVINSRLNNANISAARQVIDINPSYDLVLQNNAVFYTAITPIWNALISTPSIGAVQDAVTIQLAECHLSDLIKIWTMFFTGVTQ
jgi:hypothetical protein